MSDREGAALNSMCSTSVVDMATRGVEIAEPRRALPCGDAHEPLRQGTEVGSWESRALDAGVRQEEVRDAKECSW